MTSPQQEGKGLDKPPSMLKDIRLVFATILTDPGSSLAYGADAVIAVTSVILVNNYQSGMIITLIAGASVMAVYLVAILVYDSMTKHHVHPTLGGGAFASTLILSEKVRTPWIKRIIETMGKTGTASLLSDFPATQAISLIAGVEALYFIPVEERLSWAMGFLVFLSLIQRYGIGNLARYMIWPVIAFYIANLAIQFVGLYEILTVDGWEEPYILLKENGRAIAFWPILLGGIANGATLITGVEVGYSSINFPYHKGKAIRISMWILYAIVISTYSLQLINFLGLGINQSMYQDTQIPPLPLQIAQHIGGDFIAIPFGILTALMLLLAAQTAQSDFPLEILRASRSGFFPRGIGDTSWRKKKPAPVLGGHEGVYNPRATILLGVLSVVILIFFPHSHDIENMYGLAVVTAMCIDIASYFLRQRRAHKFSMITFVGLLIMAFMLLNILYNKFLEGAWFIVLLMFLYMIVFLFSEALYKLWNEKISNIPLEFALSYPAFADLEIDRKNIVLVSKFHPGVLHFLKSYVVGKKMPLLLHFQTDTSEKIPDHLPPWFQNIPVEPDTDTITAITGYIKKLQPTRVHLIPLLVSGAKPIQHYYFGNSIDALQEVVSKYADIQVEYNKERVKITAREVIEHIFPSLKNLRLKKEISNRKNK